MSQMRATDAMIVLTAYTLSTVESMVYLVISYKGRDSRHGFRVERIEMGSNDVDVGAPDYDRRKLSALYGEHWLIMELALTRMAWRIWNGETVPLPQTVDVDDPFGSWIGL